MAGAYFFRTGLILPLSGSPVHPAVPIGAVPGLGSGEASGFCCPLPLPVVPR